MPHRSKTAMLRGLDENEIIAGAYVDGRGGVCPMLAAHRGGGRTSLASFAKAWDRYTGAAYARRASERELRTLRLLLEESLANDANVTDEEVRDAVAHHKLLKARRREEEAQAEPNREIRVRRRRDTGERDRTRELSTRPGWSWSRLFRRYDHFEAEMRRVDLLDAEHEAPAAEAEAPALAPTP
jgi:hypothetical protein